MMPRQGQAPAPLPPGPAALAIAHPGHELRAHGWLEAARPTTFVLTDGSGRSGCSRLGSTRRVLRAAGASPGEIFGRFTDAALYRALLTGAHGLFLDLASELADALARLGARYIVSDAWEGYNPVHDACRLVVDRAVALLRQRGQAIGSFALALVGAPHLGSPGEGICLRLGDDAVARKLAQARAYIELAPEVERALEAHGAGAFATEWLLPVERPEPAGSAPEYEQHGAARVAAGHYLRVVTYRDHVRPLVEAMEGAVRWAA